MYFVVIRETFPPSMQKNAGFFPCFPDISLGKGHLHCPYKQSYRHLFCGPLELFYKGGREQSCNFLRIYPRWRESLLKIGHKRARKVDREFVRIMRDWECWSEEF